MTEEEYLKIHKKNLTPLNIKIDTELFEKQIENYNFRRWGDKFHEYPRFGLPLVNENGSLNNDIDPSCWPLDRWNFVKKGFKDTDEDFTEFYNNVEKYDDLIDETFFTIPTEVLSLSSLNPLQPIKEYLLRSCILRFDTMGHFKPHFDTWFPTKWLRLWGTTKPDGCVFRYEVDEPGQTWVETKKCFKKYVEEINIEPGRLYLHDSAKWHDVLAYKDNVYQFFIAVETRCPIEEFLL